MEQDQSAAAPESANPEAGAAASSVDSATAGAGADASVYGQNSASANPDGVQYPDSGYNGAQGADGSAYPTEHASLNGTAGQEASYQAAGAAENGGATDEMAEPMVPEQSYEDGNCCWDYSFLCYISGFGACCFVVNMLRTFMQL
jgi:pre-mRNA-processing factor 39